MGDVCDKLPRPRESPSATRSGRPALLGALALAAFVSGCAFRHGAPVVQPSHALADPVLTPLGKQVSALVTNHPGLSGVHVLDSNLEALVARVEMADAAASTLDLQSYIIWGDASGRLLAGRILQAADRGVRVRVLVDDVNVVWKDSWITRLDAHPNVELRVFNPFLGRRSSWLLVVRDFLEAGRLARRMHNKLFVADNAVAIMGGRNIGDEYFAARLDMNFEDLDVVVLGAAVEDLSRSFDDYWNCAWAYPLAAWKSDREKTRDARKAREAVLSEPTRPLPATFREALEQTKVLQPLFDDAALLAWGRARVVYDRPKKVGGGDKHGTGIEVIPEIWDLISRVREELIVISPYFVPGQRGADLLRALRQRGVRVRILTNSLGSTDVGLAQTGYSRYRRRLLDDGVELHELKPTAMSRPIDRRWFQRHATRPQTSLHAKAFIFDRQTVFVGSMNLDARAHYLNTELGLILENASAAAELASLFEESIQPEHSYRMELQTFERVTSPKLADQPGGRWPVWITEQNGREVTHPHEPGVSLLRKVWVGLLGLLPMEAQL
jgi:cardiolipin synthase C